MPKALPWNLHIYIYTLTLYKMKLKQQWCYVLLYKHNHTFLKYTPRFTPVNQRIPHKILLPPQLLSSPRVCADPEQSQGSKGTLLHSEVKCHPDKVPKKAVKKWTEEHQNDPAPDVRAPPTRHDCAQRSFTHALHTSLIWIFFYFKCENIWLFAPDLVLVHPTFSPSGSQMRKGEALQDDQSFSKTTVAVTQGNKVTAQ